MAHLQTNWNDDELEADQGTVEFEARPALSGVFCVVATGSFSTKGSHGDQELESGVSTSFCVLSGPPRSLKFEPFHVVNHSANISLTLVDGNDERARVDGAYAVRLVLLKPDDSEVDCGERPVFRGAVEFYGVAVPDVAGKYTFEALLMKGDEEISRREAAFHVQEKIPSVDESVQRRLAIRAKKKACARWRCGICGSPRAGPAASTPRRCGGRGSRSMSRRCPEGRGGPGARPARPGLEGPEMVEDAGPVRGRPRGARPRSS